MSSANRDIRAQALNLGGINIPLGGDGVSALMSSGEVGSIVRGSAKSIKVTPVNKDGTLTITLYQEDDAEAVLRALYNQRRLPGGASLPFPGSAISTLTGHTAKWSDAHFTAVPDFGLGVDPGTGTYVLSLVDYEVLVVTP